MSGPKEEYNGKLLGFHFHRMYSRLNTGEASSLDTPMITDRKKKGPRKNLLSLAKGLGKGQSSKTKTFKQLLLYFRQISQKKTVAPSTQSPTKAWWGAKTSTLSRL